MKPVPAQAAPDILRTGGGVPGCRRLWVKRATDVVFAAAGLVLLAPVMAAIAIAVLFQSGRPVIFSQERIGRNGVRFRLYKFRTLPVCSPQESDERWDVEPVDRLSRFLRATGLDELPQLYNVLRGQMSLVGPRPERPFFAARFRRELARYALRECASPGLTGWAQVNGLRGDTSIATRLEYDLYYLNNWSLAFDARILWLTLKGSLRQAAAFLRRKA